MCCESPAALGRTYMTSEDLESENFAKMPAASDPSCNEELMKVTGKPPFEPPVAVAEMGLSRLVEMTRSSPIGPIAKPLLGMCTCMIGESSQLTLSQTA